ncbi:MAG TPA: adenylate/guanylate cyclase domain-containing protein [Solirubrobacteraceae bacterium]|nr:adenylate/guanylate cyclase domain-containing protein [Solirubrobacteraceae bacterium]
MNCTACGTENPAGARFCMNCGEALERRCPSCDTPAPAEARFCMNCGAALDAVPAAAPAAPPGLPEERRQVTVLFADLSGYTAFAEGMDPEQVKSQVDRALFRLGHEVERYGGTVDKYIGDNVMALFGAPVAHEDDAERAVRAGLGMQDAMEEINAGLPSGAHFELRVGVNTGEVLAGAVGETYTVVGDTVNVASRLQSAARPGSVTVGERTMRATDAAVSYEALEPLTLKGKAEPVPAWEAVGLIAEHSVRRVAPARESPLVGRQQELTTLDSLYERVVREGTSHLVTIVGEAGVGKSRVLREFEVRLGRHPSDPTVRTGRCLPYGSGIVFWALGEVLREECGIVESDSSEEAWGKLRAYVGDLMGGQGKTSDREAALIGRLLGVDVPPELVPEEDDPERMRESFLAALRGGVEAIANRHPFVIAFEDIHWADDGLLDAIEHLAQWVRAPLMLVCLARDELLDRRAGWGGGRRSATQLFLDPLSDEHSRALVRALLPDGNEVVPAVAERSGGNPLFAEEMARRITEEGTIQAAELPDTVQAVLAARLDSLEPFERRLVQQAAVVGRTFPEGALASVAGAEGRDLGRALVALQEKDILGPAADGPLLGDERELAFKHVLIRDVAYGMLPKAVRSRKHFEVGTFIEERAGDRTDEVVALLAEHYGRAAALGRESGVAPAELDSMRARALRFLEEAGDAAAKLYANREAAAHYRHARSICPQDSRAEGVRIGEKLGDVSLRLGRVDEAIGVWSDCLDWHRGQEDLERVADLHRKIGAALSHKGERKAAIEHYQKGINLLKDGPPRIELVRLYEEAAWLYLHTGDNMLAIYASEKALRLAERLEETRAASRAHGIFGRVFGRIGDTEKARQNLERAVELARGSDDGETILALSALGRQLEISEADAAGARAVYEEALALAEQVGMLPAQVELHAWLAQLAAYAADWDQVERSTEASAVLAEREGLVGKLCLPYTLRGLLRWREGRIGEATVLFHRAHELAEQVGWSEIAFQALFGLAIALRDQGDLDGAAAALDQAIEVCERAGLIAQSIQATGARAVILALAHRPQAAQEAATSAAQMAERLHYPVGRAAALEARGVASGDAEEGAGLLLEAEDAWRALDRPLEATRARLLAGQVLLGTDDERAGALLADAAAQSDELGVPHLAEKARRATAIDPPRRSPRRSHPQPAPGSPDRSADAG